MRQHLKTGGGVISQSLLSGQPLLIINTNLPPCRAPCLAVASRESLLAPIRADTIEIAGLPA